MHITCNQCCTLHCWPHVLALQAAARRLVLCRQLDEAGYKKLERLFDMAMSDPLNDREAQPQALIRAKNRVQHQAIPLAMLPDRS